MAVKKLFLSEGYIGEELGFSIKKKHVSGNVETHWHDFFEAELIIQGSGYQIFNGTGSALGKKCLYFMTPADTHSVEATETLQLYNLMVCSDLLPGELLEQMWTKQTSSPITLTDENFGYLCALFELLIAEVEKDAPLRKLSIQSLLNSILIFVVRETCGITASSDKPVSGLQKALAYLQSNFTAAPSLGEMAAIAGMNRTYFSEVFHKTLGRGYSQYLTGLRIGYAKRLLLTDGLRIRDICFECGFGSMSAFLKAFREQTCMSPVEYRKEYQP